MSDNKNKTGSPDNDTIDINDPNEIRNWCRSFGCTKDDLIAAVKAVGKSAKKVKDHLGK